MTLRRHKIDWCKLRACNRIGFFEKKEQEVESEMQQRKAREQINLDLSIHCVSGVYPNKSVHLWCRDQDLRLLRDEEATVITMSEETEALGIMSDNEGTTAQGPRENEQRMEGEIQKEINKLKYFLEETDDLIQIKDYTEMEIVTKRAEKIADRLSDLISHAEELKIDRGASSRSVR